MPLENIVVKGAREHNLKNVDVTIPRNKLVVIIPMYRDSGKSTLAFDTIFAEGQARQTSALLQWTKSSLSPVLESPHAP